jgi:hypothetical protein
MGHAPYLSRRVLEDGSVPLLPTLSQETRKDRAARLISLIALWGVILAITLTARVTAEVKRPIATLRPGAVDAVIEQAIHEGQIPGAVLLVGHDGRVIYRKAYGLRALEPRREVMTLDTVFDLASLTKVIVTTTAVMQLVEQGKVFTGVCAERKRGRHGAAVADALLGAGARSGFEDGVGREGDGLPDGVYRDA